MQLGFGARGRTTLPVQNEIKNLVAVFFEVRVRKGTMRCSNSPKYTDQYLPAVLGVAECVPFGTICDGRSAVWQDLQRSMVPVSPKLLALKMGYCHNIL